MSPLAKAIAAYQQKFGVDGKTLAREIGMSESTLTRIKQGRLPDAEGLARLILWFVTDRG